MMEQICWSPASHLSQRFTKEELGKWSVLTRSLVSAYKEKMKELSMLSLICSCFYPEPRNMNIYKYDGEWRSLEIILQVR